MEPRLVLADGAAQRRVGRHADVVEVGNDLPATVGQFREEDPVLVGPPAGRSPPLGRAHRVRVPVQPEHGLAGEREVGVVERLAMTETDERMEHGAERLLGADVADGRYQVAVSLEQAHQPRVDSVVVRGCSKW